jgi:hypothetical protein
MITWGLAIYSCRAPSIQEAPFTTESTLYSAIDDFGKLKGIYLKCCWTLILMEHAGYSGRGFSNFPLRLTVQWIERG